jgi:hypothetical protein
MKNGLSARSRTRPNHGPRPGKRFPTWATPAGPLVVSRPSSSNGHARNPVEQNRRRRSRSNPSAHSFSLREERKRARGAVLSPSPTCAPTIGWMRHHRVASQWHHFAPACTDEVASAVNLGGLVPKHTPASGGRGVLLPPRRRRF